MLTCTASIPSAVAAGATQAASITSAASTTAEQDRQGKQLQNATVKASNKYEQGHVQEVGTAQIRK